MTDLRAGGSARFRTRHGAFDVMTEIPAAGDFSYAALSRRAGTVEIGGAEVKVVALDDLIAMKEQAHRVKDLARLPELRRIRELLAARGAVPAGRRSAAGTTRAGKQGGAPRVAKKPN
jgi:hypothetical protein